jgi:O-antigen/teichoic acid export membrane protein
VVVNLALVVLLISWHKTGDDKNDWEKFMVVYFGAFLLAGLLMALMMRLFYSRNWRGGLPSAADSRKLMRYALLAFIGNLVFFLLYRVDYLFVDRFCSPGDLGNYIQVSKLGQLLVQFPTILASVMFPLLAGRNNVNASNLLQPLSRITCFIILLACLLPVVAGGWLFPFIFGATFTNMYIPFLLLVPGMLFLGVHIILASYFAAMANIKANIISTLLGLLVILAGDIIFIPLYKIAAAALMSSLSYFVMMLYSMWVFQKKYPSGWSNFFFLQKGDITRMFRTFKTRLGWPHDSLSV